MSLAIQLREINEKMAAAAIAGGRDPAEIKLVAVSKTQNLDMITRAHTLGLRDFAENYVQEAMEKLSQLERLNIRWHFIGHLQSNKVKYIADRFALIQSVDRNKIASEISLRSTRNQEILLEVNLANEDSKSGCLEADLPELIDHVQTLERIRLKGLMFMPPLDLTESEQHQYFAKARLLRDKMRSYVSEPHSLMELSMGTSHDFEVAIREGATLVRLGTILFGERRK